MSSMNWVFLFLPSAWIISLSLQRAFFIVDRKCSPSILKDTSCQSHDLRSKGVLFSSLQYKNDQGRILVSKPDHVHASCTHHCGQRSEVLWLIHWNSSVASGQSDTKKQRVGFSSVQFSSVAQSCPTLCDPMNRSTPGLPVHHHLPEFTQTHVHRVSDAIQPSHPLSSPSPPVPNPSQHQSLFQWVNSSHQAAKVLEFQL